MKSSFGYITVLLVALCFSQLSANAQDSPEYEHPNGYDDKTEHYISPEGDNDPEKNVSTGAKVTVAKDSITAKNPNHRTKPNQETTTREGKPNGQLNPEDDSILSFNFIYYIIQKFKMQDIIE